MVFVFGVFGALQILFLKQFGVGLAAAVLIDATIIRAILLPASMKLLGDWNWYLPKWLEWMPRIEHERQGARGAAGPGALAALWGRVAALRLALAAAELETAPRALPGPVTPIHRRCAP